MASQAEVKPPKHSVWPPCPQRPRQTVQKRCCRCPPRPVCPGGCVPGTCINGQCPFRMHGQVLYGRPEFEKECEDRRKQLEEARLDAKRKELEAFMAREKRLLGIKASTFGLDPKGCCAENIKGVQALIPLITDNVTESGIVRKSTERKPPSTAPAASLKRPKSMRDPARAVCMLEVPPYTPPVDDYTELSRFLRISTMPGYSNSDTVSEYKDNHNLAVWNNQKDLDRKVFKMKRDWLSNWGEFNVKEQRWRKAWVEKFGADQK